MNIIILVSIVLINAFAILLVHQFIKRLPSKEKLIFIAITIAINYVLLSVVYGFSSTGMDKQLADSAGQFIIYMFVPVNVILTMPFVSNAYYKFRKEKLPKQKFMNRCVLVAIFAVIILIIEYFYFQSIQSSIAQMMIKQ